MRINIKEQLLKKILFAFVILTLGSCKDPAVFHTISQEEKQLEPLIKGSPTNFVKFNGNMYVGSGTTLYRYNGPYPNKPARGDWTPSTPGGDILQLAATNSKMYALYNVSGNITLKETNNGNDWVIISAPANIQTIYAENNQLFIGAGTVDSFSILKLDGSKLTDTQDKLLNGVAYDGSSTYYLSAKSLSTESGGGIYSSNLTTTNPISSTEGIPFMGIINLGSTHGNKIAAISRNGVLYEVTSSGVSQKAELAGDRKLATGALAVWNNQLLLAGRQDAMINSVNYLHGYQELELDSGGIKSGAAFSDPGLNPVSSVNYGDNGTYKSIMEKNPVIFLYQVADNDILFASTQTKGVWSYRLRSGKWQWNAEQ